MSRIAHYVASTHWEREWYETLQGVRMRLVSLLDEVFETMDRHDAFKIFVFGGQYIPVTDYLEIEPENETAFKDSVKNGKLKLGPRYVLPDEWLVSGESIIRNLQLGMRLSSQMGAPSSRAGFVCDQFGHIGQMPQSFDQLGIPMAFVWRGTHEAELGGHFHPTVRRWTEGSFLQSSGVGKPGKVVYQSISTDLVQCEIGRRKGTGGNH